MLACKQGVYPPRIVLEIDGKQATRNAVIEVNLKGANEDVKTLIHLQCPLNGILQNIHMFMTFLVALIKYCPFYSKQCNTHRTAHGWHGE